MIAIFCETPYQLLNALNLVYTKYQEECVLYICRDMFKSDVKFDCRVNHAGFIRDVKYVRRTDPINSLLKRILFKAYRLIMGDAAGYLKLYIPGIDLKISYDRIICIKYSLQAEWLYALQRNKPEVIQVEEGIGEYLVLDDISEDCNLTKLSSKKFVCEPKLYPKADAFTIEKEPALCPDAAFSDVLEQLFSFRGTLPCYRKFIYFGQAFSTDYENMAFAAKEAESFSLFSRLLGDQISVKCHPRNTMEDLTSLYKFHSLAPWECCIHSLEGGIENRVLISISSTAVVSPKLMCGKEPYIIILARLYEAELSTVYAEKNYYAKLIAFFEQVRSLYTDPQKVFIPGTFEELEEILKKLCAA